MRSKLQSFVEMWLLMRTKEVKTAVKSSSLSYLVFRVINSSAADGFHKKWNDVSIDMLNRMGLLSGK